MTSVRDVKGHQLLGSDEALALALHQSDERIVPRLSSTHNTGWARASFSMGLGLTLLEAEFYTSTPEQAARFDSPVLPRQPLTSSQVEVSGIFFLFKQYNLDLTARPNIS
jgi:hypothetical protein